MTLIAGSVQSVTADHESDQEIYKDKYNVNLVSIKDSKYEIYHILEVRNEQGQLVSVSQTNHGKYIPHKITDYAFNEKLGKKEIATIDDIKYEKVQYTYTPSLEYRWLGLYPIFSEIDLNIKAEADALDDMMNEQKDYALWNIHYCAEFGGDHGYQCIPMFQALVPNMTLESTDTVTHQWTILRQLD